MSTNLEQRIASLESDMCVVKRRLAETLRPKDWRRTVGMSKDDPDFEEMIALGREIREQEIES